MVEDDDLARDKLVSFFSSFSPAGQWRAIRIAAGRPLTYNADAGIGTVQELLA